VTQLLFIGTELSHEKFLSCAMKIIRFTTPMRGWHVESFWFNFKGPNLFFWMLNRLEVIQKVPTSINPYTCSLWFKWFPTFEMALMFFEVEKKKNHVIIITELIFLSNDLNPGSSLNCLCCKSVLRILFFPISFHHNSSNLE